MFLFPVSLIVPIPDNYAKDCKECWKHVYVAFCKTDAIVIYYSVAFSHLSYQRKFIYVIFKWRLVCQQQISRAGTSNYIPQYLWNVITCPCPWYLILPQKSSNELQDYSSGSSDNIPTTQYHNVGINREHPKWAVAGSWVTNCEIYSDLQSIWCAANLHNSLLNNQQFL